MAVALDPEIATRKARHWVDVECEGTLTRGMTVVDERGVVMRGLESTVGWEWRGAGREPNVTVCWRIDAARFKELLFRCLR